MIASPTLHRLVALTLWAMSFAPPSAAEPAQDEAGTAARFLTIEGDVVSLKETRAEGELLNLEVELRTPDGDSAVLLAPRDVLEAMGFRVEVGDRLRARVFERGETGDRRLLTQQVQNRSRNLMVRLRTLRRDPVWNRGGSWQGRREGEGARRRPGREPRRRPAQAPPRRPVRRPQR